MTCKVVENLATADFMGSLTPIPRVQIGLRLPVTYVNGQGLADNGSASDSGIDSFGMGDAELEAKGRLYGELTDPFAVGGAFFVTGPLGHATAKDKYIGDGTPTVGLRGIFDGSQGPFSFGGNLAAVYRGEGRVGSTTLGPEFRYGVGAGFRASPVLRAVARWIRQHEVFGQERHQRPRGRWGRANQSPRLAVSGFRAVSARV